jgi:ApaG protein
MTDYRMETAGFMVEVTPQFRPRDSDPNNGNWVWSYEVTISNLGDETAQLIDRHWIITDEIGRVEEVQGVGVVGEQPVIEPGERVTYRSGCSLGTSSGVMTGTYGMARVSDGARFRINIPVFSLDSDGGKRTLN